MIVEFYKITGNRFFCLYAQKEIKMELKWNDPIGLQKYADQILKAHPELNKKYPSPRKKDNTYLVDFQDIEYRGGAGLQERLCLNEFERKAYNAICSCQLEGELIFSCDFEILTSVLTNKQKFVLEKKINGHTQQEIAQMMNIARKNVIKHLNLIKNKIIKYWVMNE